MVDAILLFITAVGYIAVRRQPQRDIGKLAAHFSNCTEAILHWDLGFFCIREFGLM